MLIKKINLQVRAVTDFYMQRIKGERKIKPVIPGSIVRKSVCFTIFQFETTFCYYYVTI